MSEMTGSVQVRPSSVLKFTNSRHERASSRQNMTINPSGV